MDRYTSRYSKNANHSTGPRNRAPLGNKTTNAKATAFQTPAPPTQEKPSAKPSSPRMRRAKIKVHEAEPETEGYAEEREIEFMPSREVPMPDHPDDWPADRTYPQFEGKNLTRGWFSEYDTRKGDDENEEFSDFEGKLKRVEELNAKKKAQQQAKKTTVVKKNTMVTTARDPLAAKPTQSLTARSAASALSKPFSTARFAAPTASAKARAPSTTTAKKPNPAIAGNARHTVAKVASNSTLGYSKGRAVSASSRKPLLGVHREEPTQTTSPARPSLNGLFGLHNLDIADEDADIGLGAPSNGVLGGSDDEDEESHVFQLDTIEL